MLNDRESRFAARIRSEPRMRPAHRSRSPQSAAGGGIWRITSQWYAFRRSLRRTANSLTHRKISYYKFLIANGLSFYSRNSSQNRRLLAASDALGQRLGASPPKLVIEERFDPRVPVLRGEVRFAPPELPVIFSRGIRFTQLHHSRRTGSSSPPWGVVLWLNAGIGESREVARF
jgi:hypothetical protein